MKVAQVPFEGSFVREESRLWVPSDQYATPAWIMESVAKVFKDGWADPTTCPEAIYTLEEHLRPKETIPFGDDYLLTEPDWTSLPVFMNPPYSRDVGGAGVFTNHLISQQKSAIVLVNAATSTDWWQHLAKHSRKICFVDKRIKFDRMFRETAAPLSNVYWREATTRPRYANVIHLLAPEEAHTYALRFEREFYKIGVVK